MKASVDFCDSDMPLNSVSYETSYEYTTHDPSNPALSARLMCSNKKTSKVTSKRVTSQLEHVYTNKSFAPSPYASPMPSDQPTNGSKLPEAMEHLNEYNDYNDYLCSYALPSAPGAPEILSYDDRSVRLGWLPPDRTGECGFIDGYQVHFRDMAAPDHWCPAFDHLIAGTECTVDNLQSGRQYSFCVVAKSATGFGQPSTITPIVRLKDIPTAPVRHNKGASSQAVPAAPQQMKVHQEPDGSVLLTWKPPSFCGSGGALVGYEVQCRTEESSSWSVVGQCATTSYILTDLQANRMYEFRIVAKNSYGPSVPSEQVVHYPATASDYDHLSNNVLPAPPTDLRIYNVDCTCCTLCWSPPSQPYNGRLSYVVQCREIGDPTWRNASDVPVANTELTVVNLRPNSTYEFRIFSNSPLGLSKLCLVSDILQLRPNLLSSVDYLKTVPERRPPPPPKVIEIRGNSVIVSWELMPGVQGYQLEFCDLTIAPGVWNPLNGNPTLASCMNVNDLIADHEYSFRVTVKNPTGYSEPSEPSRPVRAKPAIVPGVDAVPLPVEMREAKESPPITDNDESPPPLRCVGGQWLSGVQYRDPTLPEVIEYLDSANNVIKLNAAGYLQHLTFNDEQMKQKVRALGGIQKLIPLLSSGVPEIEKNAAGCLRNLSYGNEDNKRIINQSGGLVHLAELLKRTPEVLIVEEVTGVLWNVSSCHELKMAIFQLCSDHLVRNIVLPHCSLMSSPSACHHPSSVQPPMVFRNATGVLLNLCSANDTIRRSLRDTPELLERLVAYAQGSVLKKDYDSKTLENCVRLTRNLSYRLQEVEQLKSGRLGSTERSSSAPSNSPKETFKKSKSKRSATGSADSATAPELRPECCHVAPLLKLDTVRLYMTLLQSSTNPDILEASAGAIQNLSACDWQPSEAVRIWVRKEKGLPIFVELLRTDAEKVKRAAACALRNLAMDVRNRSLIGKYAMVELVALLPYAQHWSTSPEDLIVAALSLIYSTTSSNSDFAKALHDRGGIPRLLNLANGAHSYSSRVRVYARQVLKAIWQHRDMQDLLRKSGVKEEDFITYPGRSTGSVSTLARPTSTSGLDATCRIYDGSKYDDVVLRSHMDRMQIHERRSGSSMDKSPPPYCSSPNYAVADPLYAQVQKMNRGRATSLNSSYSSNLHQPAGDSWV